MSRGGARPGAGRPATRVKHARPIAQAEKRIADRLPEVADAMLELALGAWVEERDADGGKRVYRKAPDPKAGVYLLDRIMGRPLQQQEVAGTGGGPLRIVLDWGDPILPSPEDDDAADAGP